MGIAAVILGVLTIIITIIIAFVVHIKTVNTVSKVESGVFNRLFNIIDKTFDGMDKALDSINSEIINIDGITGENTDEIMEKYLEVTFGEFEVEKSYYLTQTKLNLTVKNKSDTIMSFSINIEAIDENGTRLATDTIYVERLGAGQSQKEKAFTFLDKEKADELKNAKFRVYGASVH